MRGDRTRGRERSRLQLEHIDFAERPPTAIDIDIESVLEIDAGSALACILSMSTLQKTAHSDRARCRERFRLHFKHSRSVQQRFYLAHGATSINSDRYTQCLVGRIVLSSRSDSDSLDKAM